MKKIVLLTALLCIFCEMTQGREPAYTRIVDGIVVDIPEGKLRLQVVDENIIRVNISPADTFSMRSSLIVAPERFPSCEFSVSTENKDLRLTTPKIEVRVSRNTGAVSFYDLSGNLILNERRTGGRLLEHAVVNGESTWNVRQQWDSAPDEVIHGLGHHQNDLFDMRGANIDLWQENWEIAVPFFCSSRGYGILWDNYSHSKFGFPVTPDFIPIRNIFDTDGNPGALTGCYYNGANFDDLQAARRDSVVNFDFKTFGPQVDNSFTTDPDWVSKPLSPQIDPAKFSVRWTGEILSQHAGEYTFNTFTTHNIRLWIDDKLIVDGYGSSDLYRKGCIRLEANKRYKIRYEWQRDARDSIHNPYNGAVQLRWSPPAQEHFDGISMWSEVGDGIDYYFVAGPELDAVIAGYRRLTGAAPLLPNWAYGYWHSHINIQTQQEYLGLIREFRERNIPLDVLVQDLNYWVPDTWGSHIFDKTRYPDPEKMIADAHDAHVKYIISVWGMFQRGSENWKELHDNGLLFRYNNCSFWTDKGTWYYNPFDCKGRKVYWDQMERHLFRKGVDAWWLDASEPEISTPADPFLYKEVMDNNLGTGARYLNAYSLMQTKGIYENQRIAAPNKRVAILARSAFAGQQAYGTIMWTGDIDGTWDVFRKQVKCGLNFAMSGLPYWTTDIGGFFINTTSWPRLTEEPGYRELYTRWFQWGTFCPIMRTHGCGARREMWTMGDESYRIQKWFDELRYNLYPYIYSVAGDVTHNGYTMMRPLVMDFRSDSGVHAIYDQYMFGPAMMVCPVLKAGVSERSVYLPKDHEWYDFWTNRRFEGGRTISCPTPLATIPVMIRAGSILPTTDVMQYIGSAPIDKITLNVYMGADGTFTLYFDEGVNYNYEKGDYVLIPVSWCDQSRTLTISERTGSFRNMPTNYRFEVRVIGGAHTESFQLDYTGEKVCLSL